MYYTIEKETNRIVGVISEEGIKIFPEFLKEMYIFVNTDEYLKTLNYSDEYDKILKLMSAAKLYNEIWDELDGRVTKIDVTGDWKHDHIFTDQLMESIGYTLMGETITDSDDSDYYSAIHSYVKTI